MKAGLLSIAALSALAAAQPHLKHYQLHEEKREVVVDTAYATEIDTVTATAPAATVWVDQNGHAMEGAASTPAPVVSSAAPAPAASSAAPEAPKQHENAAGNQPHGNPHTSSTTAAPAPVPTTTSQAPAPPAPQSQAPASSAAPAPAQSSPASSGGSSNGGSGSNGQGLGITYSPYFAGYACKSADDVAKDMAKLSSYSTIRVYNTDCNQIANVLDKAPNAQILIGIVNIDGDLSGQVSTIISQVGNRWSRVQAINVGNELVNNGVKSAADVAAAVKNVRDLFSKQNLNPKVVTVDTFIAIINNPSMCDISDDIYANCHAFFDVNTSADKAGSFVLEQAQRVASTCKGKNVIISESGWPSQGLPNGAAIPGTSQQQQALDSLKKSFSSNLFLFNAFNNPEKNGVAGDKFNVEPWWGVFGNAPA